jgi:DNA modification methylase
MLASRTHKLCSCGDTILITDPDLDRKSRKAQSGEPSRAFSYRTIEDAAKLTGLTEPRLRQLTRTGKLPYRGSLKDPLFAIDQLRLVRPNETDPLPAWLLDESARKPPRKPGRPPKPPVYAENSVVRANVLDVLPIVPDATVSAVVTSPPYWGQRVYADETRVRWRDGCLVALGREDTPEEYVRHTLEILSGLLRVLRPDGTIWWNIADSYMTRAIARSSSMDRIEHYAGRAKSKWAGNPYTRTSYGHEYLKDKDVSLIPFLVAIGAQKLGYYVRSIIVWSKQMAADDYRDFNEDRHGELEREGRSSHMPEKPTLDRPVVGHEYILLLAREGKYGYHVDDDDGHGGNLRTVWTFRPALVKGSHSARFPDELPRRCIRLGSRRNELIFDPFVGEGTTLRVARDMGRRYFGCDVSRTYVRRAAGRLSELDQPHTLPLPSVALASTVFDVGVNGRDAGRRRDRLMVAPAAHSSTTG